MDIRRDFDDDDDEPVDAEESMSVSDDNNNNNLPTLTITDVITVMPEVEWLINDTYLPILYYNTSTECPHHDAVDLLVGASWPFTMNQPHWIFRQAIFERNYFPYKHKFYYLTIHNGFIAIDGLNLCYLTDRRDTRIVYMKIFDKFRQRMVFHENGIYLTEFITQ